MLGKRVLLFGAIIVIMTSLLGGCLKGTPTSKDMPVLSENKEPANNGYGVYINFRHTQPGVYSEVFVTVYGSVGEYAELTLQGPAVSPPATQKHQIEDDGSVTFSWKITKFGTYTAQGDYSITTPNSQNIKASVDVK